LDCVQAIQAAAEGAGTSCLAELFTSMCSARKAVCCQHHGGQAYRRSVAILAGTLSCTWSLSASACMSRQHRQRRTKLTIRSLQLLVPFTVVDILATLCIVRSTHTATPARNFSDSEASSLTHSVLVLLIHFLYVALSNIYDAAISRHSTPCRSCSRQEGSSSAQHAAAHASCSSAAACSSSKALNPTCNSIHAG
jgi:hypothetical protein